MMRTALALVVALGMVVASSCDSGPSGPGTLSATISGPQPLGAALVEITGMGVLDFVGQGDSQVYGAQTAAATGTFRVLVVSRSGGTLRFGIEVDDLAAVPPVATVLTTVNPANAVMLSTGVVVEIQDP